MNSSSASFLEFLEFLERVAPEFARRSRGASPAAIRDLAHYCPSGLPSYYEWFLSKFGDDPGPLSYPRFDFSIESVLAYHQDKGPDSSNWFVIAVGRDPLMSQSIGYDLRHRTPADARVAVAGAPIFDSLEAMLAWRLYKDRVLSNFAQRCRGVIRCPTSSVETQVERATTDMGFTPALDIGPHAPLLDGPECAMALLGNYHGMPTLAFDLATASPGQARWLLGQLAVDHGFELVQLEWEPALA